MKNSKYKSLILVSVLAAGMGLSGCGGTVSQDNTETTEVAAVTEADTQKQESTASEETSEATSEAISEEATTEKKEEKEATTEEVKAVTMYTTVDLTLRKEASKESEDLGVVAIGSMVQAYEESGDYIKVTFDGKEGYVLKSCVTESKEEADQAVEAAREAEAAAATAAAEEAESSSDDSSSKEESKKKKKKDKECLDDGLLN